MAVPASKKKLHVPEITNIVCSVIKIGSSRTVSIGKAHDVAKKLHNEERMPPASVRGSIPEGPYKDASESFC